MKINELKDGMSNVDLTAKVVTVEEPKQVATKFGTVVKLTNVIIEDTTGKAKLTLWGDKYSVSEGQTVKITNGFVKEFRGEMQISTGRAGKLEVSNSFAKGELND